MAWSLPTSRILAAGSKTLRRFEEGENILTIPHGVLWTVEHACVDPFLGPVLLSTRPPLSVDDTLATYILFVRSRVSGYNGLRSHVSTLPTSYTSSVFFVEAELEVCAGTSLYTTTKQLDQHIEDLWCDLLNCVRNLQPERTKKSNDASNFLKRKSLPYIWDIRVAMSAIMTVHSPWVLCYHASPCEAIWSSLNQL